MASPNLLLARLQYDLENTVKGCLPTNKDLIILFIEDNEAPRQVWLKFIQETWSKESRAVRSTFKAKSLIAREDFQPHLVLHDCKPVEMEDDFDDTEGNSEAGNQLYSFFVEHNLPVVILTGDQADTVLTREPYRTNPPLGILSKPLDEEKFYLAVKLYCDHLAGSGA